MELNMQTINESISLFMSPNTGGPFKVLITFNWKFNYSIESKKFHAELLNILWIILWISIETTLFKK